MTLPSTIKVGSLVMSLQAFVVASAGLLLGLCVFVMFPSIATAVLSLILTGIFFLYAYNINCVVVGHCTVLSWVLTAVYLTMACSNIIGVIAARMDQKPVSVESHIDTICDNPPIIETAKRAATRIASSPKKA